MDVRGAFTAPGACPPAAPRSFLDRFAGAHSGDKDYFNGVDPETEETPVTDEITGQEQEPVLLAEDGSCCGS
jgi:hypothetical protein